MEDGVKNMSEELRPWSDKIFMLSKSSVSSSVER